MKVYLLVIALAAAAACGKKNEVTVLQHEAVALGTYYQPKLDAIDSRIQGIMKRGQTIPADFPGVKEVGQQLQEARDTAAKLRGIVGTAGQKSALENQAEAAAKDRKVAELSKLVRDTEETFEHGMTIIDTDLSAVERWIFNYDNKLLAIAPAPPQAEVPPPPAPAPEQGSAAAPATPPTQNP